MQACNVREILKFKLGKIKAREDFGNCKGIVKADAELGMRSTLLLIEEPMLLLAAL